MYEVIFSKSFTRRAQRFFRKHPQLYPRYEKAVRLLKANPHHPSLRLHKLSGSLRTYYSISISMDYRVLLDFVIEDRRIILLDIGDHDEVYRS